MSINNVQHIHCIGVGGIGVSAVAAFLHTQGKKVTGSDLSRSLVSERLEQMGMSITYGAHTVANFPEQTEAVIYSPAISETNPERVAAQTKGIAQYSYPEAVAQITVGKKLIVVSGTHGKSTTTSMIAHILMHAGKDPLVIVGTLVPEFDGNMHAGNGEYAVIEGDEYRRSFYAYTPYVFVVTNIEADHLDYYTDLRDIQSAFTHVAQQVTSSGCIISRLEDAPVQQSLKEGIHARQVDYGEWVSKVRSMTLMVPGEHNRLNASAAWATAAVLGISDETIREALATFSGVWRRFEVKGTFKGVTVVDDYAHHPSEISATISAARERFPGKNIWCIFQPHQRSRTKKFFADFVRELTKADHVVVTRIYDVAGREHEESVSGKDLYSEVEKKIGGRSAYVDRIADIPEYIVQKVQQGDIVITMGAGSITTVNEALIREIQK